MSTATLATATRDPWYLATTPLETRPWLIRLRWVTVLVEMSLLAVTFGLPRLDLPLDHIAALIVADAVANVVMALLLSRSGSAPPLFATVTLTIQLLLVTALLELTGGPSNPFVVVYGLQIALALLTLGTVPAVLLSVIAGIAYAVLIYWHA